MSISQRRSITSPLSITEVLDGAGARPLFPLNRMTEYFGVVNYATNERVLAALKHLSDKYPVGSLYLMVTSAGGPSGSAMSFYDSVRYVLRPNLITIGAGDVDSSGLIIFLTGERRHVTRHTTALLHKAGRTLHGLGRLTASELLAMAHEDSLKDEQYASIVSERSAGRLTKEEVLDLMEKNTTLNPEDFVRFGLAESIIG